MIRIMIVDDHQIMRDGLRQMLSGEEDFVIAGEATNGREALDLIRDVSPDVILMDVGMPVMDGIEATARIHTQQPEIRILALTMHNQGSMVQLMLRNGAQGYLLKDTGRVELIEAIRVVHSGERYLGKDTSELLVGSVLRQQVASRAFLPDLTRREKDVLKLITHGMSDVEIAAQLNVSPATVESHRKNLRSKLGARNSAEIVRIAMERGLTD
jgi:two-component system, NarL family, nitrate/nitrite response regulator NarL